MFLSLLTWSHPVAADQKWSVRLLGVGIGDLRLSSEFSQNDYAAQATFETIGVAGALAKVRFELAGKGSVKAGELFPAVYQEDMNTGRRHSQTQMRFDNGRPIRDAQGENATDVPLPKDLGRPLDPLSALLSVLRPVPLDHLCAAQRHVFDGSRLTHLSWSKRLKRGDQITCIGLYERVAGYSTDQLSEKAAFEVSVDYFLKNGLWTARRAKVVSLYGPVTLVRQD